MTRSSSANMASIRLFLFCILAIVCVRADDGGDWSKAENVFEFNVTDIDGNLVPFAKYRGYVLIVVNVASECTLTETNYQQLNELYTRYERDGLRIAAFPSNQFHQEPGDAEAIKKFIASKNVQFDVYAKVDVNGDSAHPLYKWLKSKLGGILSWDAIKWNFTKFLIDIDGRPVKRYGPLEKPKDFEQDIVAQLAKRKQALKPEL